MSQSNWEADKMLDVYIHDYLLKRKLHASAKAFMTEGKVAPDPVAIDAPGGFLLNGGPSFGTSSLLGQMKNILRLLRLT
ncbi:unnamed protein product [Ilex paraguariensis]|uniref:LisH domain-containing protein n=1 Tax=Ilex paraguariensis TaxID=185542 RepID=A0ABC8SF15_9AQUA